MFGSRESVPGSPPVAEIVKVGPPPEPAAPVGPVTPAARSRPESPCRPRRALARDARGAAGDPAEPDDEAVDDHGGERLPRRRGDVRELEREVAAYRLRLYRDLLGDGAVERQAAVDDRVLLCHDLLLLALRGS